MRSGDWVVSLQVSGITVMRKVSLVELHTLSKVRPRNFWASFAYKMRARGHSLVPFHFSHFVSDSPCYRHVPQRSF